MFININNLLPQAAKKQKIWKEISSSQACFEAQKILDLLWQYERKPKVSHLKSHKLMIKCGSSSEMQELYMIKDEILKQIGEKKIDNFIKELQFALD